MGEKKGEIVYVVDKKVILDAAKEAEKRENKKWSELGVLANKLLNVEAQIAINNQLEKSIKRHEKDEELKNIKEEIIRDNPNDISRARDELYFFSVRRALKAFDVGKKEEVEDREECLFCSRINENIDKELAMLRYV